MKSEYYEKLEVLVKNINVDILSAHTLIQEAKSLPCSSIPEKDLLEELINKAEEYLKLEDNNLKYDYSALSDREQARKRELMGWFTDLYVYNYKKLKELFLGI